MHTPAPPPTTLLAPFAVGAHRQRPQKPLKPSNINEQLNTHPQSIIFLNVITQFNISILEIFTNNLVTYLYGLALKLWYA